MGVYPFMFGALQDFKPIVDSIIAAGLKPPYDWDEYAGHFLRHMSKLTAAASSHSGQDQEELAELYM